MNKVILMGRLTGEPRITRTEGENPTTIAKFSLAVDRKFDKDKADFPSCTVFGKSAEFVERYITKGSKVVVCGRLQTGSYENKDRVRVYTTDVVVDEIEFAESKKSDSSNDANGFMNVPDGIDVDELPFQ